MKHAWTLVLQDYLLVFWLIIIFVLSHQANSSQMTGEIFGTFNYSMRKLAHISEFAILSGLTMSSLQKKIKNKHCLFFCSFLFSVIYAFLDEFHQIFVPGRTASYSDVLVDTIGIFLGICVFKFYTKLRT